ncbi:hypothetical protein MHYP_G00269770, partial [Metynnis hypsauchen]
MMSGGRRVSYARIPAHSILFSLVEEEKGRDCGKISTIYMKTPGGPLGEIYAKLEVYMWLGITKYSKNCVTSLPAEFRPIYEVATFGTPLPPNMPPSKLAVE